MRQPAVEGVARWDAVRDCPLLIALTDHSQHPPIGFDIGQVETAQLPDPNTAGIKQFHNEVIAECDWVVGCWTITIVRRGQRCGNGHRCLVGSQNGRQDPMCFWRLQSLRWIGGKDV